MSSPAETLTPLLFDVTAHDFDDRVAKAAVPVLVDFWAPWCGPCQHIAPILESLVERYQGRLQVAKVNVDEEGTLAAGFNVRSIPMLVLFHEGKVVEQIIGLQPEQELVKLIDKYVANAPNDIDTAVQDTSTPHDQQTALAMLENALEAEPDNAGILADIARTHAALGNIDSAQQALKALPGDAAQAPDIVILKQELALAAQAASLPATDALQAAVDQSPDNNQARFDRALRHAADREYSDAMNQLMTILSRDLAFSEGKARGTLLSIFDILGTSDADVQKHRRALSTLLN